jgi:hypothetical protein
MVLSVVQCVCLRIELRAVFKFAACAVQTPLWGFVLRRGGTMQVLLANTTSKVEHLETYESRPLFAKKWKRNHI